MSPEILSLLLVLPFAGSVVVACFPATARNRAAWLAAIQRAEAWRKSVEELSVAMGDFNITFTISLGVAAYPEHGKTPDDLTRCADQALYRAKHEGRNQVAVHLG